MVVGMSVRYRTRGTDASGAVRVRADRYQFTGFRISIVDRNRSPPCSELVAAATRDGAGNHDVERALELLQGAGTGGNLTTDAQIAAIALRHRAIIHTADTDYARFPDVSWKNPLPN